MIIISFVLVTGGVGIATEGPMLFAVAVVFGLAQI